MRFVRMRRGSQSRIIAFDRAAVSLLSLKSHKLMTEESSKDLLDGSRLLMTAKGVVDVGSGLSLWGTRAKHL